LTTPSYSLPFPDDLLDVLVERAANLAAAKVEERTWAKYMDAATAARYTSLSPKAITNAIRSGKLQARKISGEWSIPRAALDEYMERR
jgi:excisionase family DNA binding protein